MRVLILTNQLEVYAGSEIVALEVTEAFQELGYSVDLYAGHIDDPVKMELDDLNLHYGLAEDCPDPFSYDIIWSQHHILPYLISKYYKDGKPWPFIVSVSLSPFEPYELPGAIAEISDTIVVNSSETAERLISLGIDSEKLLVFHNAAPNRFSLTRKHNLAVDKVAIISNHAPQELVDAVNMLSSSGITVDHIGLPGNQLRVTPEILQSYDAVISIGKSVQYCILSETPVFMYDRFGGPGWLTNRNHQNAEHYNFSGRCSKNKLTSEQICDQFVTGYSNAIKSIKKIKKLYGQRYNLSSYIINIIEGANVIDRKRAIPFDIAKTICREGILSGQMLQFYRTAQAQAKNMAAQKNELLAVHSQEIKEDLVRLHNAVASNERNLIKQIAYLNKEIKEKNNLIDQFHEDILASERKFNETIGHLHEQIDYLERSYDIIRSSNSWKLMRPFRVLRRSYRHLVKRSTYNDVASILYSSWSTTRLRNGARYLLRGDFKGLLDRIRFLHRENTNAAAVQNIHDGNSSRWTIMSTPHTLFLAQSIADHLETHNIQTTVVTEEPSIFDQDFYIVLCAQMFDRLPPNERRILFQLEQSVSSRWFSDKYIYDLENSLAVFEYSLKNIEFLETKGIKYPHVHYIPIGLKSSNSQEPNTLPKEYDFLFYGDSNSSPRRRKFLSKLQKQFNVKICNNLFGKEMHEAIQKAKIVVNIHYYEGALLETPRIQECISLGVPVLSEGTNDKDDYPELFGAVRFFKEDSIEDMLVQAEEMLADIATYNENLVQSAKKSSDRFSFMLDRALVAIGLLPVGILHKDAPYLPKDSNVVALSLPETISRRRVLTKNLPDDVAVFDGARYRPGWIGCGLSFKLLAMYARKQDFDYLIAFEDDVLLPDHYESRVSEILGYLTEHSDDWDVFSGMMAEVHPDTRILSVEVKNGITYATVNRMVSTVFNIYNRSAIDILAEWDPTNHDVVMNPIDRYLQNADNLRIVVSLPFFAGHREDLDSTLWGFQNERYAPMIAKAETELRELAEKWLRDQSPE